MSVHGYTSVGPSPEELKKFLPVGVTVTFDSADPVAIRFDLSDDAAKEDLDAVLREFGYVPTPLAGTDATEWMTATFPASGIVTLTFTRPFVADPRVMATARAGSGPPSNQGRWVEVVSVTTTQTTLRLWQNDAVVVVAGSIARLVSGTADVQAYGRVK